MLRISFLKEDMEFLKLLRSKSKAKQRPKDPNARKTQKPYKKTQKRKTPDKRVLFKDTVVGRQFYVYAPLHYAMLMQIFQPDSRSHESRINYSLLENISISSKNPVFKTTRFRKALVSYRLKRSESKARWTLKDALYFAKVASPVYTAIKKCAE